jgi:hypothetical protein
MKNAIKTISACIALCICAAGAYAEGTITIISPQDGDLVERGSVYCIKWTAENIIGVDVEYSLDGGVEWHQLNLLSAVNTDDSLWGNYPWQVPDTACSTAIVQITEYNNWNVSDVTGTFTIGTMPQPKKENTGGCGNGVGAALFPPLGIWIKRRVGKRKNSRQEKGSFMRIKPLSSDFCVSALVAVTLFVSLSFAGLPITNGLVGWWSFNEGSGTTVGDVSGNGHTGTVKGGAKWADGKFGKGIYTDINNESQKIEIPSSSKLKLTDAITAAAWVCKIGKYGDSHLLRDGSVNQCILTKGGHDYVFALSGGHPGCVILASTGWGGGEKYSKKQVKIGAWQHVAVTWQLATKKVHIYFDGVEDMGAQYYKTTTSAMKATDDALVIANRHEKCPTWREAFGGTIDEVCLYNRELSAAEIKKLYEWEGDAGVPTAAATTGAPLRIVQDNTARLSVFSLYATTGFQQYDIRGRKIIGRAAQSSHVPAQFLVTIEKTD